MPVLVSAPSKIKAAGKLEKIIEESGWEEPGQKPDFDEYSIVLRGTLRAEGETTVTEAGQGQAIIAKKGEWIRYSTPGPEGAQYVAVCTPAFSPDTVHRDE